MCLIGVTGKVYEQLINKRLIDEIEQKRGLNEKQYGFRHGNTSTSGGTKKTTRKQEQTSTTLQGGKETYVL